jgi:Ca2+-binding EF-hand superfamily protein
MTPKLLKNDSRDNINQIFALFDSHKTGFIGLADLRKAVRDLFLDLTEEDVEDMIVRADEDKDGFVSQDEFFNLVSSFGI